MCLFYSVFLLFSSWYYGQVVGDNCGNRYYIALVFIGTWTIYQKDFMEDWLPYVRVKITGLFLNLLRSFLFTRKDERKKDQGHLEGWREGELLCACPADPSPDQPVLSRRCTTNFAAQPEQPRGFPSAPRGAAVCRGGELHGGLWFSGNLCWYQSFAGGSQCTVSPYAVHPIQLFPLLLQRSFGLQVFVFPSSRSNTDIVQELMSAEILSWT